MYQITIFSNRVYTDESGLGTVLDSVDETIEKFSRILYAVYNLVILSHMDKAGYKQKLGKDSLHMYVKKKYGLDDYYANSIVRIAKGKVDAQMKLNKEYKKQKECALKEIRAKLKDTEKKLHDFLVLRENFLQYRDAGCAGKLKIKGIKNISIRDGIIEIRYRKDGKIVKDEYNPYSFEYGYLNGKIGHLKSLISKYTFRINRLESQIGKLGKMKHCIFGTKKLMQEYCRAEGNDRLQLKEMIRQKKYKSFLISGRKDAKTGNYVFKPAYDEKTDSFSVEVKMIDGTKKVFHDIRFPYRQSELLQAMGEKTPIAFGIVRKVKDGRIYYLLSVSFNLETVRQINEDISTGVIGIDFNYGHVDISETDGNGNMVNSFTLYYDKDGKSYENDISLHQALDEIVKYASEKHKTIVIEALDLKVKKYKANRDKPKHKSLNKILHNFPYEKYNTMMHQLGMKYKLLIREVNPAFTSVIGKHKYAGRMKLSTHIAASFVIARRGMGLKEKVLKEHKELITKHGYSLKSNWAKWSLVNKMTGEASAC